VRDKVGQKAFIDGNPVGTSDFDHSDFDWKSEIRLGFSEDLKINFVGRMKDILYEKLK
jgi:hypothetical protein